MNTEKVKSKNETANGTKSVLGAVRKYIFPILLLIGLIIGNLICHSENSRILKPTTNMVIGFLIIAGFVRSRN
jgi:positive regulator of sigma E activity